MERFTQLVQALQEAEVRFVVIGVGGANYFASRGSESFPTKDRDLFLPPDVANELRAWEACVRFGLTLFSGDEPLGEPRDTWLAERVVERRMVVTAVGSSGFTVDLSLVMAGMEFDEVWAERRIFETDGVDIPVARLAHIIQSKRAAGREKDLLFLVTHEQALRDLLKRDE